MSTCCKTRQGTILIIVAGIAALLASLSLTFLVRMRSDVEESQQLIQEAQARLMLSAACAYLLEASRLGYDLPGTQSSGFHPEGYGWIDVRDGAIGPKVNAIPATSDPAHTFPTAQGAPGTTPNAAIAQFAWRVNDDSRFPIGTSRRFEMYRKHIPPFAIRLDAAPNPIDPNDGIPWLSRPDPIPVLPRRSWNWNSPTAADFAEFATGDPRPVQNSVGISWFRLHRCGPGHPNPQYANYNAATFIVTVGAGGTGGFRWFGDPLGPPAREMSAEEEQRFGSAEVFNAIQATELRQWYLVEWSPAVGGQFLFNLNHHRAPKFDATGEDFAISQYSQFPQNCRRYGVDDGTRPAGWNFSQGKTKSFGGSIRLVQRLMNEPPEW